MLRHHQFQGVLCAAFAAAGLLLTSCTQDRIEPAPVAFRGVNRTINSSGPLVGAPLPAPRSASVSPAPAVAPSQAHRAVRMEHASGAAIKSKRSAGAQKVHRRRAPPQMARAGSGKVKVHRVAKTAAPATTLARSHRESIPLDEPVTRSAEPVIMHPAQTPPAWVPPAPIDVPQSQFRPAVP